MTEQSDRERAMAERSTKRRKQGTDGGIAIHEYFSNPVSADEMLFKINELLYGQGTESTRRNVRVPIKLPISYVHGGESFTGQSYTLSQAGMFIKSPEPLPLQSEVSIEILLPGEKESISIIGEVIQQTNMEEAIKSHSLSGMVVLFRKIRSGDRRRIDRFVRSRAKEMHLPR